eukprot:TRINITY_DN4910_c0_g1_i3.p1 TRINITY_DN4910_c0_g1~~TRINITY_DN4910_c0_g1_i3.p1  ORF type:complete len:491 (+),score=183.31 TRINITY_DN4910_c0_g1_i3:178-1473(+)
MANVFGNPYKMQFFPQFESQIRAAKMFRTPIVDGRFLDACIQGKRLLDVREHLIFPGDAKAIEIESELDPRVQSLIEVIFDKSAQRSSIAALHLDPIQLPSLTESSITQAYTILSNIDKAIELKSDPSLQAAAQAELVQLSQEFYRVIPHTVTPVIDTNGHMKSKMETLETLRDLIIANSIDRDVGNSAKFHANSIDIHYKKLKTQITPLEKYSREYDIIKDMVLNTHCAMHKYFSLELLDIFEVEREGEIQRFHPYEKMPHHRMLWHGSRVSNMVGILSQGLRIAPPEAPVSGYFLGKGLYFGDMISKSVEYCHPDPANPYAILLLCDIALGRSLPISHTKFIEKSDLDEANFQSVKGCGELGPDPAYDVLMQEGVVASLGREIPTGVFRSEISHNEFIVYDVGQVRIKYLIKLKVKSDRAVKAAVLSNF